jgi:hypothetical protein
MIRKLKTGEYRIYSLKKNLKTGKRRNLGTFTTREAAEKHERENEPPRSKLRGISWLVATLQAKQASGNITRRDSILQKTMTYTIRRNEGLKWMITFIECQQFSGS